MNKNEITNFYKNHNLFKIKPNKRAINKVTYWLKCRLRSFLKMESIVASFIDAGKLLKRTAPEYLTVIFPSVYTDFLGKFIGNLRITLL